MYLGIGQIWWSSEFPHESFEIYSGIVDTTVDSFSDESLPFENQPEGAKIFFWKRADSDAFQGFIDDKYKGRDSIYPHSWYGESKKSSLISKIKKYKMFLVHDGANSKPQ